MPTIVQTFHGKVTGLWGTAHMRGTDGKMHLLKLGDVVQKGDVILTTQNGIVQLDADATGPLPASVAKATAGNAGAPDEIDRVIAALNDPTAQDAPAAGLSGGDGAGDLAPGLRVDRVSEGVTPSGLSLPGADDGLVSRVAAGSLLTHNAVHPVLSADSNIVDASEEGAPVGLGLTAPTGTTPAAVITVTQIPVIGQLQKADGTVVVAGSVISASDLVGLKYVPPADYNGSAAVGEFGYTVTEGGSSASGTVGIVLTAVNDAPVAVADTAGGLEDTTITGNVLSNDSDVDGPALQVTQYSIAGVVHAVGTSTALVGIGSITVNADGSYSFVPVADYNGPVPVIGYTVSDGALTSSSTLTLSVTPVNDAPVATNDAGTGLEDTPQTGNVLSNDTDVDGNALSVTQFVVGGTTHAAGTTATLAGIGTLLINADGSYSFTPAANYNGPVPVATYTMTDGSVTQSATLTLSVAAVNDAPVAADDLASTPINTPVVISVLANDSDVDGDTLTVSNPVLSNPALGSVVVNADGTLGFTPATNVSGTVTISYTVSDGHGGTDTASVTVNVGANTPPTGADSVHVLVEDGSYTLVATDFGFADADAGQTLANVRIDTLPGAGTLLLNGTAVAAGAVVSAADIAAGHLVFVPAADGNGAPYASVTFSVQDSAGAFDAAPNTLTLNVTPQPDAAVISGNAAGVTVEDTTLVASGKLDVTDPDAGEAAFVVQNGIAGAHGSFSIDAAGNWTYTLNNADPAVQALGAGQSLPSEVFAVRSIDGTPANVTVSITGTDDAPVITTGSGAVTENTSPSTSGTLTASDVDNPALAFVPATVSGSYGSLVLQADGQWTYTLDARAEPLAQGQVVSEPITVTLSDGSTTTVTVAITGTDDAPVISVGAGAVTENTSPSTSGTLVASDVDNPGLAFVPTTVSGNYGSLVLQADGQWTYTLDARAEPLAQGQVVSEPITVTLTDGSTTTVTITVSGTNDGAVITPAVASLTETDAVLTTSGTLAISDIDSPATFAAQTNVAGSNDYGHFTLGANGAWTYTTDTAHNEFVAGTTYTDKLTVTSSDGTTSTITVNILGTNDAAVITPAVVNLTEANAVLTTSGTLAISDIDSPATFVAQTNAAGSNGYGKFTVNADGTWTYATNTAHNEFVAGTTYTDKLTVTSADGTTSTITVNILGTNDAAVIAPKVVNLTETNAALTTGGTLTISDVDSPATFVAQTSVAGSNGYGHFTLGANGTWTYAADTAHNEFVAGTTYTDKLTVTSADGTTSTITVNILGTNDAPVNTIAALSTNEDTALKLSGLAINDADAGSGTLTVTLKVASGAIAASDSGGVTVVSGSGTTTLVLKGSQADINAYLANSSSQPVFTPAANANGTVALTMTTSDSGNSGTGAALTDVDTVNITVNPVNDAPVNTITALTTNEDTALRLSGLKITDVDASTGSMTITLNVASGTLAATGTANVVVSGSGSGTVTLTGTLANLNSYLGTAATQPVFTPAANANGTIALTMTTNDHGNTGSGGALTDTDTVNITVNPVNDAPVNTIAALSTNEDTALKISGLAVNDVDAGTASMTVTLKVASGTLTAASGSGVLATNSNATTVVLTGTQADINAYLANSSSQPVFTPVANASGTVNLTMTTSDNGNTGSGGTKTDVDTVAITVVPVNDAPVNTLPAATQATTEDTTKVITGVSVADIDSGTLTTTLTVAHGTLTLATGGGATIGANGSGTVTISGTAAQINAALAAITYKPVADFNGADTISVATSDGTTTTNSSVAISVAAVVDIVADVVMASEGTAVTFNPITGANETSGADNFENAGRALTAVGTPQHGSVTFAADGSITYTPNTNYNGLDSFTYTVTSSGVTETSTITVNVAPVNDAAVPSLSVTSVGRWTFDEASGATTTDAYHAQTGTLSDSVTTPTAVLPTWTTGHNGSSGTALHFDGTGSYVALSATTTAPLMGTSSLTFWIKTTQTGNVDGWDSPAVIASEQAGGTNDIQWGVLNASGKIGFDVGNAAGVFSTTSVNDNTWHQVAITRDAATGLASVYVDGVLEATGSPTDAGFTATLNMLTGLGATNNFANDASSTDLTDYRFLNADLDDVRIYDHVLTADQVAAIKAVESGYSDTAIANDGEALKLSLAATDYTALSVHGLNTGMVISDGAGHTTTIGASGTDTVVDLTGWNLSSLSISGAGTGSSTLVFDATDTVSGDSHTTTQYLNIVNGTSLLSGGTGNDTLTGTSNADLIVGNAGNDTLNGGAGNDRILGGDGNDTINGGANNDIIYGGAGNDVLTGGTGADTFAWHLADRGTAGTPASDAITDFNVAPVASGGDTLDLRDLLVGANHVGTDPGNLSKYLDFDTTSTPGSTVIHVSSTGGYAGGTYAAASTDETITLQGVDLRSALGLGAAASDNQIITELLTRNKLVTDGH